MAGKVEPYHETKGKGLSLDKLNTTIFLIISTTSSQVPELVTSIQETIIISSINLGNDYCKEKQNS